MAERFPDSSPEGLDPLEAELESFWPAPMSVELTERIDRELRQESRQPSRLRIALAVGLAAAACVVVAFYGWGRRGDGAPDHGQLAFTRPTDAIVAAAGSELPPPTVAAYQRALAKSPDALDALLDAHAPRLFPAAGGGVPAGDAFHSSRTQLSASNGDTL